MAPPNKRAPVADPRGLVALTARYLEHLRVAGYSPVSVRTRHYQLARFNAWCEERSLTRAVEVTKRAIEQYQHSLFHYRQKTGEPLSKKSQNGLVSAVLVLFKWLEKQRLILNNPGSSIELPRFQRRLPHPALTISEVDQVLNSIDITNPFGLRDRAMLELAYSTGMRRTELAHLRVHDIDTERELILVKKGKGDKERMVPVGARALAWLDRYLLEVRPFLAPDPDAGVVFLSRFGTAMSPPVLTQIARKRVEASGLDKAGALHILRHSAATSMLEAGADIRIIQELLGHAYLSSTQIYTKVTIQKLKEVHAKTHPAKAQRSRGRAAKIEES